MNRLNLIEQEKLAQAIELISGLTPNDIEKLLQKHFYEAGEKPDTIKIPIRVQYQGITLIFHPEPIILTVSEHKHLIHPIPEDKKLGVLAEEERSTLFMGEPRK